jgi:hypothetical protein
MVVKTVGLMVDLWVGLRVEKKAALLDELMVV